MMQDSLAERLRVLRARQGLTLIEAAEKAGVGRDTLSNLERGRSHPVMPTLAKIAKGYGVPVEKLLEEPVPLGEAPGGVDPLRELPRRKEEAAFVVVGRLVDNDLRMVVQWNVPEAERDAYIPTVRAMLGDDYLEEELPAKVAEALGTA